MSIKLVTKLKNLKHLDLKNEEAIILAIFINNKDNNYTPLELSKLCTIPRASIYNILEALRKRGFVKRIKVNKKVRWVTDNLSEFNENLQKESRNSESCSDFRVYRGNKQIKKIIFEMISGRKDERFKCFTAYSDLIYKGWLEIFNEEELNSFNSKVKDQKLICELVAPNNWIEDHYNDLGRDWGSSFLGRTASGVYLDQKYFNYSAQIFAFHDAIYLLSLTDRVIIEIRNKNIIRMLISMYTFMQERGNKIDLNEKLRKLISTNEVQ